MEEDVVRQKEVVSVTFDTTSFFLFIPEVLKRRRVYVSDCLMADKRMVSEMSAKCQERILEGKGFRAYFCRRFPETNVIV